ncbi:putative U box domain, armadillo-like helical, Zinc finger, RING/FYVE/PHD-type [Helianthus annuus]|nr:putative U box domain, armadillo-like helical, Zinc finger, RING/FYVE/PHD-type [Helianthus annuus]KAJ0783371.1 putative U box domain, armadillo-like helical, Zinc finger, RING/FYVE/PHD-type [Helianthus annuus]KAJ0809778.1 putative U box domain, armadillo-like helical, Zinc finger, RING/FYVE/PHD-type [Helianthus annuus]KAJ0957055.1 putative U box domain, armadillo-like helical, Zinc finger, RING/FYVE/PHD-type [Helianthus annuus]
MAKSGVFERDPTDNLKKALQKLVKTIVEDSSDDEILDQTVQILQSLKQGIQYYPQEFNCPLSKEIMTDPVIICTGKTYDRVSIQKWLSGGNRTCPETGQVLSHTVLTPNHLVRDMIAQWCKNHRVRALNSPGPNPGNPVQYLDEQGLTEADRKHFRSLLKKLSLSDSISEKKEAARMLRSLTKKNPAFRGFFGECSTAIPELISPLSEMKNGVDPNLCEDVITTLLNVSIHESNKKPVVETVNVVPVLLDALRLGTIETRTNAAATLFTLSALDSNKLVIGKAGGLRPLIELLEEGHALAMKDAASAIFNLCIVHENKTRAVRDGAVSVLLDKINHRILVDELVAILAMLSSNQKAVEEMCDLGAVSCLFSVIRETTCARNKENCIAILYAICFSDRTKWKEMREEESRYETLSQLAENGNSRAKRKASGILDRINRPFNRTHTA